MLDEMGDDQLSGSTLGFFEPAANPSNPPPKESLLSTPSG